MLVFWDVVAPDGQKSENLSFYFEELTNFPLSKKFETFFSETRGSKKLKNEV